jgi:stage V sporulation protein G
MEITDVKIFPRQEDKLKAYVTVIFDNAFVVRNLKIIKGNNGLFVAMPSRKRKDGTFMEIAHPLTNEMRHELEERVLTEYKKEALLNQFSAMPGVVDRQEAYETN